MCPKAPSAVSKVIHWAVGFVALFGLAALDMGYDVQAKFWDISKVIALTMVFLAIAQLLKRRARSRAICRKSKRPAGEEGTP